MAGGESLFPGGSEELGAWASGIGFSIGLTTRDLCISRVLQVHHFLDHIDDRVRSHYPSNPQNDR
jgi:hypothetical protein